MTSTSMEQTTARSELRAVSTAARGRWPEIFDQFAPELADAMASAPFHVACPVHGGTDGFRLFSDYVQTGGGVCNTCGVQATGAAMLAWVTKAPLTDIVAKLQRWLQNPAAVELAPRPARVLPAPRKIDREKAWSDIQKTLAGTVELANSAGELYLMRRGIWKENQSPILRMHPSLLYYSTKEKKSYGNFPCLIAPLEDPKGRVLTLHRTFLTATGDKAPVPKAKKLMTGRASLSESGCAIKLFPAEEILGLAEGIETALASRAVSRMPVWACATAQLMEQVVVPDTVRHVVIWADLDTSGRGLIAAERLANRLEREGRKVEICLPNVTLGPDEKGVDWLNVLLQYGINGFPARWRRWRPEI